jgi:glutamate/tyrosine decarboxylase-like PLP-dependent enzyme
MIGYPASCGGILVTGGNMANFVCFLAARKAKIPWDIRNKGVGRRDARTAEDLLLERNAHLDPQGHGPLRAGARCDSLDPGQ